MPPGLRYRGASIPPPFGPDLPGRRATRRGAKVSNGIWGMDDLVEDMSLWEDRMDDSALGSVYRSIYVTVEKGGTGYGGFFRRIYGRFLLEAASELGLDTLGELGELYISIGNEWTDIANLCRQSSDRPREALPDIKDRITETTKREKEALLQLEQEAQELVARSDGLV